MRRARAHAKLGLDKQWLSDSGSLCHGSNPCEAALSESRTYVEISESGKNVVAKLWPLLTRMLETLRSLTAMVHAGSSNVAGYGPNDQYLQAHRIRSRPMGHPSRNSRGPHRPRPDQKLERAASGNHPRLPLARKLMWSSPAARAAGGRRTAIPRSSRPPFRPSALRRSRGCSQRAAWSSNRTAPERRGR